MFEGLTSIEGLFAPFIGPLIGILFVAVCTWLGAKAFSKTPSFKACLIAAFITMLVKTNPLFGRNWLIPLVPISLADVAYIICAVKIVELKLLPETVAIWLIMKPLSVGLEFLLFLLIAAYRRGARFHFYRPAHFPIFESNIVNTRLYLHRHF